jgi:hypothetical protein
MSLDAKILELRLLLKESALGQASLSKCAAKLHTFGKNLEDNTALEGFLREILMYRLEHEKTDKIFRTLHRQSDEYGVLESEIEGKVAGAKNSIASLEEELRQQKSIREHRVECEHAASIVNKQPSRSALKRKIDAVSQSVESTNASIGLVEAEIAQKQVHFNAVLQAIADLQKCGVAAPEDDAKAAMEVEGAADGQEEEERDDNRDARNSSSSHRDGDGEGDGEGSAGEAVEVDEYGNPIEDVGEGDNGTEDGEPGGEGAEEEAPGNSEL